MALRDIIEPYFVGPGGRRLTEDEIAERKALAAQKMAGGIQPIGHWTQGMAQVADALVGGLEQRNANKQADANATESQSMISRILSGDQFPEAPTLSATAPSIGGGGGGVSVPVGSAGTVGPTMAGPITTPDPRTPSSMDFASAGPSDDILTYANQGATRNRPLVGDLEANLRDAAQSVYGPGYRVKVYSGGQAGKGEDGARTGSVRHDHGRAADVHMIGPDGKQVKGDALAPLGQYWAAKKYGGVGMEMHGGGIHLDNWVEPPKGGGMAWDYSGQGGQYTPAQQAAIQAGLRGELPSSAGQHAITQMASAQPVSLDTDPSLPAGMRNNNPGNIKFNANVPWDGLVGPSVNTDQGDPQAVFETPELGMRAAYKLAVNKYNKGARTANDLIAGEGGWTPGNTQAAANIARTMGVAPDEDLNLTDPARAQAFIRGLVTQEHGGASQAYSDDMISNIVSTYAPEFTGGGAPVQVASLDPSAGLAAIDQNMGAAETPAPAVNRVAQALQAAGVEPGGMTPDERINSAFGQSEPMAEPAALPVQPEPTPEPQPVQVDQAPAVNDADIPVMAGGSSGAIGPGQPRALNPAIIEAMSSPYASPQAKQIANIMFQQHQAEQQAARDYQMQQADPMRQLQLEKAQLEIANMRNPSEKVTDTQRNLQWRAEQAGLRPGTPEYQKFMMGGENGTTINVNTGESEKFYENLDKKLGENVSALSDEGTQARRKIGQIDRLEELLSTAPGGTEAAIKVALGEWGIPTKDLDSLTAANALINELVPQQRQPGSGPMSDADLALFKQSLPRLINQPGGNKLILDTMRGITQYQIQMGDIADLVADRKISPAEGRKMIRELANPLGAFGKNAPKDEQAAPAVNKPISEMTVEEMEAELNGL